MSVRIYCCLSLRCDALLKFLSRKNKRMHKASFIRQTLEVRTHFRACSILCISWVFSITPASVCSPLWLLRPSFQNKWVNPHLNGLQCFYCHAGDQMWHMTPPQPPPLAWKQKQAWKADCSSSQCAIEKGWINKAGAGMSNCSVCNTFWMWELKWTDVCVSHDSSWAPSLRHDSALTALQI